MLPGKASVLLLLLCLIVCIQKTKCEELPCTEKQKKNILSECHEILNRESMRIIIPRKNSPCCRRVRDVLHNDMNCIVKLLTLEEKMAYVE
uniref:Bifunctional inhibitor/plant lipid transfer protein/seed storage helical domain-containing protein n=1 Tax=Setaria italica TaxID=4555 RepID=K3ZDF4_SETIT